MYYFSGTPNSRHVLIVDDLIKTGGTIIECAKVTQLTVRSLYYIWHCLKGKLS